MLNDDDDDDDISDDGDDGDEFETYIIGGQEMLESGKKLITFVKLHAPWDVCCHHAEDLCLRAPLQVGDVIVTATSQPLLTSCSPASLCGLG